MLFRSTYYCGFRVNSGEYKLMGLAPYGQPKYADTIRDHLLDIKKDGSFRLDLQNFNYCQGLTMTNAKFESLFGHPARKPETDLNQFYMDMAASVQLVTEELMLAMARHARELTGKDKLCLAGGVALPVCDREGGGSRFVQAPDGSVTEKLVAAKGQRVQVLAPRNDPGKRWTSLKFDAKAWEEGLNGVGYEDVPGEYKDLIATKIMSKKGEHPHSVFVRIPFKVEDPGDYAGIALYMRYDDGFVAYLNGFLMASKNAPNPLRWNSAASAQNSDKDAVKAELFKVKRSLRNMKKGWNILAVQVLNGGGGTPNDTNTGCTSSDLLLLPELVALRKDNTLPDHAKPKIPSSPKPASTFQIVKGSFTWHEAKTDAEKRGGYHAPG